MPSLGSLLSLSGRTGRAGYWLTGLGQIFGLLLLFVITGHFDPTAAHLPARAPSGGMAGVVLFGMLAIAWVGFAVTVRRWHDRDKSAWWCIIGGVPLLGPLWMLVELGFLPGTAGSNRFGPPSSGSGGGGWARETSPAPESGGDLDAVVARWAASPAPAAAAPRAPSRFAAPVATRPRVAAPARGGTFGRRGLV